MCNIIQPQHSFPLKKAIMMLLSCKVLSTVVYSVSVYFNSNAFSTSKVIKNCKVSCSTWLLNDLIMVGTDI